jgi:hypothetical protein
MCRIVDVEGGERSFAASPSGKGMGGKRTVNEGHGIHRILIKPTFNAEAMVFQTKISVLTI